MQEVEEINGKIFDHEGEKILIRHWDVDKQLEILAWLTKNFGEGIMALFMQNDSDVKDYLPETEYDDNGALTNQSQKNIQVFAREIFQKLEPKEYTKYMRIILQDCMHGPKKIDLNMFKGKMVAMHTLAFEVLCYQYSDFL